MSNEVIRSSYVLAPRGHSVLRLTADQFRELFESLDSVKRPNKSRLARRYRISRPTLYSYLASRKAIEAQIEEAAAC